MNRRDWAMVRLVAWSITAVALVIILILGMTRGINWFSISGMSVSGYHYADANKYTSGGAELAANKVNDLDINWIDGEVQIEVYNGNTVKFYENSSSQLDESRQLQYYNKNGRLMIQYQKSQRKLISRNMELDKELVVKIPKETATALGYVGVDTVSSDTKMEGITAKEIELDSTSGNFQVTGCEASEISMDSTSGGLTGETLIINDELSADTTSGDVRVEGRIQSVDFDTVSGELDVRSKVCPDRVKTDSVSGNIYLTIPDNDGFTYSKDTTSGSVSCEFDVKNKEDKGTYKNGDAKFEFDSVSGDFSIKKL